MALATAIALGGLATSAIGAFQAGSAARSSKRAAARLGEYNAMVSEQNALATEQQTRFDQIRAQKAGRKAMGSMRAKLGASGVEMTEGAPLNLQIEQAFENELQLALIGESGKATAAGHRSDAVAFRMGAATARTAGGNMGLAGGINAGSTLLTGFGRMYSTGVFGGGSSLNAPLPNLGVQSWRYA